MLHAFDKQGRRKNVTNCETSAGISVQAHPSWRAPSDPDSIFPENENHYSFKSILCVKREKNNKNYLSGHKIDVDVD